MKNIGRLLLAIIFLATLFNTGAMAQILVNPADPFEKLGTHPLLPDDPKGALSMPEEVRGLLNSSSFLFDLQADVSGDDYPFPVVKMYVLLPEKNAFAMFLIFPDHRETGVNENSLIEIRWFTMDSSINPPSPKMKSWINLLLIEKLLEEMETKPEENPDEKIKI